MVWRDGSYQSYKHRQWDLFSLTDIAVLAVAILAVNDIVAIVFSSMTIEVNENELDNYYQPKPHNY
ncbi:MAG: hypothetical protein P8Y45_06520 [Exilibacterium sp.]